MSRWIVLLPSVLVACGALRAPVAAPVAGGFVLRQWTRALAAPRAGRCTVVDTASVWREERAGLAAIANLPDDWCRFAVERAVVIEMPGAAGPPVRHDWHREEGVDVVTVTPAPAADPSTHGLVHAFVVQARAAQLAIVWRGPGADGLVVETTLAVFPGR